MNRDLVHINNEMRVSALSKVNVEVPYKPEVSYIHEAITHWDRW